MEADNVEVLLAFANSFMLGVMTVCGIVSILLTIFLFLIQRFKQKEDRGNQIL